MSYNQTETLDDSMFQFNEAEQLAFASLTPSLGIDSICDYALDPNLGVQQPAPQQQLFHDYKNFKANSVQAGTFGSLFPFSPISPTASLKRVSNFAFGSDEPNKAKRRRTTPDQLAILEKFFAGCRTPNGEQRKDLSKRTGMTERSVQIWFQNRRAKVKSLERRQSSQRNQMKQNANAVHLGPDIVGKIASPLSPQSNISDEHRSHDFHDAGIELPLNKLNIGSWTRLTVEENDLIIRLDPTSGRIYLGVRIAAQMYYIIVHFRLLRSISISHNEKLTSIHFELNAFPEYALHKTSEGAEGWYSCTDFTQGRQASQFLRHALSGKTDILLPELKRVIQSNPTLQRITMFTAQSPSPNWAVSPIHGGSTQSPGPLSAFPQMSFSGSRSNNDAQFSLPLQWSPMSMLGGHSLTDGVLPLHEPLPGVVEHPGDVDKVLGLLFPDGSFPSWSEEASA
jgi:hypothetical protein